MPEDRKWGQTGTPFSVSLTVREALAGQFPAIRSDKDFGFWSHTFEDSHAHITVKHALFTALLRVFNRNAQYVSGANLYVPGFGHFFSGTIPDNVSARPGLFIDMTQQYYGYMGSYLGTNSSPVKFMSYARLIASIPDSDREEFIKYVVRDDCNKVDRFDGWLSRAGLTRMKLDQESQRYILPGDSKLNDEQALDRKIAEILLK